jgi:hypothetical protein
MHVCLGAIQIGFLDSSSSPNPIPNYSCGGPIRSKADPKTVTGRYREAADQNTSIFCNFSLIALCHFYYSYKSQQIAV